MTETALMEQTEQDDVTREAPVAKPSPWDEQKSVKWGAKVWANWDRFISTGLPRINALIDTGKDLNAAKADLKLDGGKWLDWLKHIDFDQDRAGRLMRVARELGDLDSAKLRNLRPRLSVLHALATLDPDKRAEVLARNDLPELPARQIEALKPTAKAATDWDDPVQAQQQELRLSERINADWFGGWI